MKTRKLMKFDNGHYGYFVDGITIHHGPLVTTRMHMERDGLRDIDFAVKVMKQTGDDVADFGVNGGFILTQKFEETNLGFGPIKEV